MKPFVRLLIALYGAMIGSMVGSAFTMVQMMSYKHGQVPAGLTELTTVLSVVGAIAGGVLGWTVLGRPDNESR